MYIFNFRRLYGRRICIQAAGVADIRQALRDNTQQEWAYTSTAVYSALPMQNDGVWFE